MKAIPSISHRMSSDLSDGHSPLLMGVFLGDWIFVVLMGFWFFQLQYASVWVSFEGEKLPTRNKMLGVKQVVHFVDEQCPCSKFSIPHINELEARWSQQAVQFSTLDPRQASQLDGFRDNVPASPSVAIWDESGAVEYFGPYTAGAFCGEGADLLAPILANQTNGQWLNQEAVGCFCQWPKQSV